GPAARGMRSRGTVAATEAKNRLGAILDVPPREPVAIRRQDRDIDDKFLEAAVNGRANVITTGDNDLLDLDPFRGVAIVTSAVYLDNQTWQEGSAEGTHRRHQLTRRTSKTDGKRCQETARLGNTRIFDQTGRVMLLERESELAAIEAVLRRSGAILLSEGGVGLGKTSLVEAGCARAEELGYDILRSRG